MIQYNLIYGFKLQRLLFTVTTALLSTSGDS